MPALVAAGTTHAPVEVVARATQGATPDAAGRSVGGRETTGRRSVRAVDRCAVAAVEAWRAVGGRRAVAGKRSRLSRRRTAHEGVGVLVVADEADDDPLAVLHLVGDWAPLRPVRRRRAPHHLHGLGEAPAQLLARDAQAPQLGVGDRRQVLRAYVHVAVLGAEGHERGDERGCHPSCVARPPTGGEARQMISATAAARASRAQ
jgi:hypothetical protein